MDSRTRALFTGAGAAIGLSFLGVIPFLGVCFSCIALLSGGMVSVWAYTSRERVTIPGVEGAQMGALVGCIAFAITTFLMLLVWLAAGMPNLADALIPRIEEQMSRQPGASAEQVEQVLGLYRSLLSNPALLVGASLFGLAVQVIGGTLGGLIGASIFRQGGEIRSGEAY